jgi:hypothetical protein
MFKDSSVAMTFAAIQPISDRYYYLAGNSATPSEFNSNVTNMGWASSYRRTFCQEHIYQGLPQAWQSLISPTTISTIEGT